MHDVINHRSPTPLATKMWLLSFDHWTKINLSLSVSASPMARHEPMLVSYKLHTKNVKCTNTLVLSDHCIYLHTHHSLFHRHWQMLHTAL